MDDLSQQRQKAIEVLFAEYLQFRLGNNPEQKPIREYVCALLTADLRGEMEEITSLPPQEIKPVIISAHRLGEQTRAAMDGMVKDIVSALKGFSGRAEPDPPQPSVLVDPRADYIGEQQRIEWTKCGCGNTHPADQRCEECLDREQREERQREQDFEAFEDHLHSEQAAPEVATQAPSYCGTCGREQNPNGPCDHCHPVITPKTPEAIHQEQQVAVPAPEVAPIPAEQRATAEDYLTNVFEGSILTEFESGVRGIKAVTDLTDRQARKVANDFRAQAVKAQAQDDAARVLSMGLNRTEQRSPIVEEKKPLNEAGLSALIAAVDDLPDGDEEEIEPEKPKDLMPRDMVLMAAKQLGQATFSPSELVPEMRRLGWTSGAAESSWGSIVGQIIKRMPEFALVERGVWKLAKAKK